MPRKVMPMWIEMSLCGELSDLRRYHTVGPWAATGRSRVNGDADLRARFVAAGIDYVWVTFILGDEEWSEPQRRRYQRAKDKLTVAGWAVDPGSTGEEFENWFATQLRELLEGWKHLPKEVVV